MDTFVLLFFLHHAFELLLKGVHDVGDAHVGAGEVLAQEGGLGALAAVVAFGGAGGASLEKAFDLGAFEADVQVGLGGVDGVVAVVGGCLVQVEPQNFVLAVLEVCHVEADFGDFGAAQAPLEAH